MRQNPNQVSNLVGQESTSAAQESIVLNFRVRLEEALPGTLLESVRSRLVDNFFQVTNRYSEDDNALLDEVLSGAVDGLKFGMVEHKYHNKRLGHPFEVGNLEARQRSAYNLGHASTVVIHQPGWAIDDLVEVARMEGRYPREVVEENLSWLEAANASFSETAGTLKAGGVEGVLSNGQEVFDAELGKVLAS